MRLGRQIIVGLALFAVAATVADAETPKCQRAVAKASAKYLQSVTKAAQKCTDAAVKAGTGTCPDAAMTSAVAKADAKLASAIGKDCGGSDGVCNGDVVDEDLPAAIGWPSECPNVASGLCNDPITTCADVTACLRCIAGGVAGAESGLAFDALVLPSADASLNKCQRALGKADAKYAAAVSKALAKCWDGRITGKHTNACEPPAIGDGKYLDTIAKADAKRTSTIAKACGGADHALGGGDDLTPAAIGFVGQCPGATVPGGPACGGPITDLTSVVACLDCVSDAMLACADRAAVPQLSAYPPECAACLAQPMTSPCPTTIALAAVGGRTDVDLGWNGLGHDVVLPTNSGLTLAVSGCDGTNNPTCGECDLSGPISGVGGPSDVSRRCALDPSQTCTSDVDCPGDACVYFIGPPQPFVAGGFPFCLLDEVGTPVTGTINLTDGSAAASLSVRVRVFPGVTPAEPCPTCAAGTCTGGTRDGQACTSQGDAPLGAVSLDCPPNPSMLLGGPIRIDFPLTTGVQSRSVSAASPTCRQTGFTALECMCDTCNEATQTACFTNADCPSSGGAPGICGGRRCIGGSEAGKPCNVCLGGANHGATCVDASACPGGTCSLGCGGICAGGVNEHAACTASSECPGSTCALGQCNRPGEATQPNACQDDTATPGLDCAPTANGEGICSSGPLDARCSIDTFVYCGVDDDCVPVGAGGTCEHCTTTQQSCAALPRECFTDDGTPGNPVLAVGASGPPCGGVSRLTLAALACAPPVSSTLTNTIFGLPGLARTRLPIEIQLP
jgi:hypothetical protein